MSMEEKYINQLVKLVDTTDPKAHPFEGKLTAVNRSDRGRLWDTVSLDNTTWEYHLTDVAVVPVEVDGHRLPVLPGVYRFFGGGQEITAQLTDNGDFFPYPYVYSGWREVELFHYPKWEALDIATDYPEILNPEDADRVRVLEEEINTLTGVDPVESAALARKLVLDLRF